MKTENKNFLYNVIYQLLTFIIPFVTVPYVSRVLGVDNVGIYSYTYSIAYMFMLAGMLGINNYGNRAVAAVRDDPEALSRTFTSIYMMQLMVNMVSILAYVVYIAVFCHEYRTVAMIQSLYLVSICFDVNWFFFGIEKFKLTITRNMIIKLTSVVLIFLFVRSENDVGIYTLIMSGATLLSQMFLVALLPHFVKFRRVPLRAVIAHLRGILLLFIPVLAFGVYKVMDKTMIGVLASVTEVGLYENAEKIMNIPAAVIAALGTVMLPRMSYLFSKEGADFRKPILESMRLASRMSSIMCLGLILIADDAVVILFGADFAGSGPILVCLSVTVIASSWANVIRTQYLIPLKKDGIYIRSTIGAAILNLIFNYIFIQRYAAIGACIGTILAEYFVALYQMIATGKELEYGRYLRTLTVDLLRAAGITGFAYILTRSVEGIAVRLTLRVAISAVMFLMVNRRYITEDFLGRKQMRAC